MNSPRPLSEARKRALEVLKANPAISEREAAKLARVSRGTVRIVRIEYAAMLPKLPLIIGGDGKVRQRRRRFITLNGKRKLRRLGSSPHSYEAIRCRKEHCGPSQREGKAIPQSNPCAISFERH